MEQLGKAVQAIVRQTDLAIKYTSWALAVVLPDTPLAGAQLFAEKLKKAAGALASSVGRRAADDERCRCRGDRAAGL